MSKLNSSHLFPAERESLEMIDKGDTEAGILRFVGVFAPRLKTALLEEFQAVDLDMAFEIKQSTESRLSPFAELLWEGEELTPFGESFLSWVEEGEPEFDSGLTLAEFHSFLEAAGSFCEQFKPAEVAVQPAVAVLDEDLGSSESEEEDAPEQEALEQEAPEEDAPEEDAPEEEALEQDASEDDVSEEDAPEQEAPEQDAPEEDAPEQETPEQDAPETVVGAPPTPSRRGPVPRVKAKPKVDPEPSDEGEVLLSSQAPLSPLEKKNQLIVRNKFLGYGKNTEGVVGLCGQLKISYFDDKDLVGRLESSNPLLFISPSRLSGRKATITYWLPPLAFPHPAGHLSIRTPGETKMLALHSLFPRSRTDYMSEPKVVALLFAPAVLGCLYFGFVYVLTVTGVDREAQSLFPVLYEAALEGVDTVDFRSGGLGLYRLKVVPASESLQMIWAAVLFFAPLLTSKFFHYLSKARQRRLGGFLAAAQLLPTLCLLIAWNFQDRFLPLFDHKDFAPLDLREFLYWGVPANIGIGVYLFLSVYGVWDKIIKPREVRVALPFLLTLVYLALMFFIIYGRSWMA